MDNCNDNDINSGLFSSLLLLLSSSSSSSTATSTSKSTMTPWHCNHSNHRNDDSNKHKNDAPTKQIWYQKKNICCVQHIPYQQNMMIATKLRLLFNLICFKVVLICIAVAVNETKVTTIFVESFSIINSNNRINIHQYQYHHHYPFRCCTSTSTITIGSSSSSSSSSRSFNINQSKKSSSRRTTMTTDSFSFLSSPNEYKHRVNMRMKINSSDNDIAYNSTTTATSTIPSTTFETRSLSSPVSENEVDNLYYYMTDAATTTTATTKDTSAKLSSSSSSSSSVPSVESLCPPVSPATGLYNRFYKWKCNQMIRYQCTDDVANPINTKNGDDTTTTIANKKPIVLIHGLFVNCDHWRKTLIEYTNHDEYVVYALDLLGCGYSDKPIPPQSYTAKTETETTTTTTTTTTAEIESTSNLHDSISIGLLCNGENGRFIDNGGTSPSVLNDVILGTTNPSNPIHRISNVELRHPLGSPYNFYTWSELVRDFVKDVVLANQSNPNPNPNPHSKQQQQKVALVCNSIGTMTALQAVIDDYDDVVQKQQQQQETDHKDTITPSMTTTTTTTSPTTTFSGVFVISPNFRELHTAEITVLPSITVPILQTFQRTLRETFIGKLLFDTLAKPNIVKQILLEPYHRTDNVTIVNDELVQVLLDPLITTPNARDVIFDTLSYSAGPLPEQQLQEINKRVSTAAAAAAASSSSTTTSSTTSSSSSSMQPQPWDIPIWVCYGTKDPWTPSVRVERMKNIMNTNGCNGDDVASASTTEGGVVRRVIALPETGHCPHDEAPELVHPLLYEFLSSIEIL